MMYRRKTTLEIRTVGDEVIVHDLATKMVHVLNATAGNVLELCDGTRSIADVTQTVAEATGVHAGFIKSDIDAIVKEFGTLGLVEPV